MTDSFLQLLHTQAPREAFDALVERAENDGVDGAELAALREERDQALQLRSLIRRQRAREAELSALYDTASDLTAIRDVDAILVAIVRRARQLLNADMTYLSLNDEGDGASYMKVTDGALTAEFRRLRLPLGTGLLGLVAQAGAPYYTSDYQSDERFVHRDFIDSAVDGEHIRAILGVPLTLDGRVIGALLAVHRTVREFPPEEVTLLTSFAAHAAVALENAQLFARLDHANRTLREHTQAVEQAATAHDELTGLLLAGAGVAEVAASLTELLGGPVTVLGENGDLLAGPAPQPGAYADRVAAASVESTASGRAVLVDGDHVVAALASTERVGTLVLHDRAGLAEADRRTLERGALVTALILVFARTVADAEERLGSELLSDLLDRRETDTLRLRERARRKQVQLDGALACLVVRPGPERRTAAHRAAVRFADSRQGLAADRGSDVVVLVPAQEPVAEGRALQRLLGIPATVGAAPAVLDSVPEAHREALRCVDVLEALGRTGGLSDPAGLGISRLLLDQRDPQAVQEFLDATLGPVLAYDARRGTELVATLSAWFASGASPKAAAEMLHVHANTVVQRLERVDTLLGDDWRDPARSLDVQLALRVARLRALD